MRCINTIYDYRKAMVNVALIGFWEHSQKSLYAMKMLCYQVIQLLGLGSACGPLNLNNVEKNPNAQKHFNSGFKIIPSNDYLSEL